MWQFLRLLSMNGSLSLSWSLRKSFLLLQFTFHYRHCGWPKTHWHHPDKGQIWRIMFRFARQVCKLKTATLWLLSMHVPKWNNFHMKYQYVFDFHYWSLLPFDLKWYVLPIWIPICLHKFSGLQLKSIFFLGYDDQLKLPWKMQIFLSKI